MECSPLYDIPVMYGSLASEKSEKVNGGYTIIEINNGVARCVCCKDKTSAELSVDDRVSVADFGKPIYL